MIATLGTGQQPITAILFVTDFLKPGQENLQILLSITNHLHRYSYLFVWSCEYTIMCTYICI